MQFSHIFCVYTHVDTHQETNTKINVLYVKQAITKAYTLPNIYK